jgi:hypothetical protein
MRMPQPEDDLWNQLHRLITINRILKKVSAVRKKYSPILKIDCMVFQAAVLYLGRGEKGTSEGGETEAIRFSLLLRNHRQRS